MIKKIALFGTSADPPTAGHQMILKWLAKHYDLVAVWASDNPYKNHQTHLQHRVKMLQLLIEEIHPPQPQLKICPELSYLRSLMSVRQAQKIWGKESEYHLVIGSDLIVQVPRWYGVQDLLKQVKILIISRPNYPICTKDLKMIEELGGDYLIADLDAPAVSSTAYRETQDQTIVTTPIQDYIHHQKLYL